MRSPPAAGVKAPAEHSATLIGHRGSSGTRPEHTLAAVLHPFTFRVENQFLPLQLRRGTDPDAPGDLEGELRAFLRAGIDGCFTDNPAIGARVVG